MGEKLNRISELTSAGKYAYVEHIDGDEFICKEDCNGWEEDGTPNLLVITWEPKYNIKGSEILIEDDIKSVEEYNQTQ